jgi:phospho-N-acetylmuramoyl-pentapeptide-transferase
MTTLLSFFVSTLAFYLIRKGDFSKFTQPQREILKHAETKAKTKPIPCGGIIFFVVFSVYSAYTAKINYQYFTLFGFFLIGLIDDLGKIIKKSHISFVNGKGRIILEATFATIFLYFFLNGNNHQVVLKNYTLIIPLIIAFPILVFFIIGTANAVNLTDGQDGLAGKTILVHLFFLLTVSGNNNSVLVLIATLLAFLLFNTKPATIYMGDSGSLLLGAFLAISFLNAKIEYLLPLTGLVFVVETLSVIIQVTYFKATKGKRIFKMAPLQHHLELCNISEEKITNLAFVTTIITCFVAYFLIQ